MLHLVSIYVDYLFFPTRAFHLFSTISLIFFSFFTNSFALALRCFFILSFYWFWLFNSSGNLHWWRSELFLCCFCALDSTRNSILNWSISNGSEVAFSPLTGDARWKNSSTVISSASFSLGKKQKDREAEKDRSLRPNRYIFAMIKREINYSFRLSEK